MFPSSFLQLQTEQSFEEGKDMRNMQLVISRARVRAAKKVKNTSREYVYTREYVRSEIILAFVAFHEVGGWDGMGWQKEK